MTQSLGLTVRTHRNVQQVRWGKVTGTLKLCGESPGTSKALTPHVPQTMRGQHLGLMRRQVSRVHQVTRSQEGQGGRGLGKLQSGESFHGRGKASQACYCRTTPGANVGRLHPPLPMEKQVQGHGGGHLAAQMGSAG